MSTPHHARTPGLRTLARRNPLRHGMSALLLALPVLAAIAGGASSTGAAAAPAASLAYHVYLPNAFVGQVNAPGGSPTATPTTTAQPTGTAQPTLTPLPGGTPTAGPTSTPVPIPNGPWPAPEIARKSIKQAMFYSDLDYPPGDTPQQEANWRLIAYRAQFIIQTGPRPKYVAALRANGYKGHILRYYLAKEVEGPLTVNASSPCKLDHDPISNQVATEIGDFCTYIHPHEDWFLHNGKGERIYNTWIDNHPTYHMNPKSQGWRDFVRARLLQGESDFGIDGIYLDNVELNMTKVKTELDNSDGTVQEFKDDTTWRAAWTDYLKFLGQELRKNGKVVYGNMLGGSFNLNYWKPYLQSLDGVILEYFATGYSATRGAALDPATWKAQLTLFEGVLKQGKGVVLVGRGEQDDEIRQKFSFASYLLITDNKQAYFRYAMSKYYGQWWQYPNFDVELGAPKGARTEKNGVWRREFACGYVTVNLATRNAEIVQSVNPCK